MYPVFLLSEFQLPDLLSKIWYVYNIHANRSSVSAPLLSEFQLPDVLFKWRIVTVTLSSTDRMISPLNSLPNIGEEGSKLVIFGGCVTDKTTPIGIKGFTKISNEDSLSVCTVVQLLELVSLAAIDQNHSVIRCHGHSPNTPMWWRKQVSPTVHTITIRSFAISRWTAKLQRQIWWCHWYSHA